MSTEQKHVAEVVNLLRAQAERLAVENAALEAASDELCRAIARFKTIPRTLAVAIIAALIAVALLAEFMNMIGVLH